MSAATETTSAPVTAAFPTLAVDGGRHPEARRFSRDETVPAPIERRLVERAGQGAPGARDALVDAYRPLIAGMARRYRNTAGVDRAELMQEGVVGLLRALERYDATRGVPFWAYAVWWVRHAMQQLVSEMGRPVVLSDRALRQLARVRDARRRLGQAHGLEPRVQDLADETGLALEHVEQLVAVERSTRSLDVPAGEEPSGATIGELIADPRAEDGFDRVSDRLLASHVPTLLGGLTDRERVVICARFGLAGAERTLRELADDLGLSAERVRQIESVALDKMRGVALRGDDKPDEAEPRFTSAPTRAPARPHRDAAADRQPVLVGTTAGLRRPAGRRTPRRSRADPT